MRVEERAGSGEYVGRSEIEEGRVFEMRSGLGDGGMMGVLGSGVWGLVVGLVPVLYICRWVGF